MTQMYRPFAAPTTPALLQMVARRQAARVAEGFAAAGLTDLRPGHAQLLVPLLGGGRRVSELADGLGVTRQAVAQAVTVLERGGYVERVADPDDGRARLVRLTPHGMTALRTMRRTALTLEGEWSRHLGPDGLDQLRELLTALLSEDGGGSQNGAGNTTNP